MKLYTTTIGGKKHILQAQAAFNGSNILYAFCSLGTTNADWATVHEIDDAEVNKKKSAKTV